VKQAEPLKAKRQSKKKKEKKYKYSQPTLPSNPTKRNSFQNMMKNKMEKRNF
jgi:hypothetical protein